MPQKRTARERRTRRITRSICTVVMVGLGFAASACANSPNPCGEAFSSKHIGTFRDPYTQRRQFLRSAAEYRMAKVRIGDDAHLRDATWRVCINAQGLEPFTREVASDIRPRFSQALDALVFRTRMPTETSEPPFRVNEDGVEQAIDEFLLALPRFWSSPAGSLRGSRQPGSPLRTHY